MDTGRTRMQVNMHPIPLFYTSRCYVCIRPRQGLLEEEGPEIAIDRVLWGIGGGLRLSVPG